jgi:antitoxin component YwqK of YwqJK toxin-antitoxin module
MIYCGWSTANAQQELRRSAEGLGDVWLHYFVTNGNIVRYSVEASNERLVLDGPFSIHRADGRRVAEGVYKNGVWDGELKFFHTNGHLSSCQWYKNGKADGTEIHWNENGKIQQTAHYLNGEKDGAENYWSSDERVVERIVWSSGQPRSVELFEGTTLKVKLTGAEAIKYITQKARGSAKRAGVQQ